MSKHLVIPGIVLATLIALLYATQPRAEEGFQISTSNSGRDNASGLFERPDSRILPISVNYETGNFTLAGTVSYLQQKAVRDVPYVNIKIAKSSATDSGSSLADYIARDAELALTYKVPQTLLGGWSLDVTGAMQFQNGSVVADRAIVLRNYTMDLEFSRLFGDFTSEIGVGYKLNDQSADSEKRNAAYGYVGGKYQMSATSSVKVYFDMRQGSRIGAPTETEVSAYFNQRLPWKKMSLQSYVFKGLSENNRAIETGCLLQRSF